MPTLIAIFVIFFDVINIWVAFKSGTPTVGPLVVGVALVGLGLYIFPADKNDQPEIYYRK